MINLNSLRENQEKIKSLILKKEPSFNIDKLIQLDGKVRILLTTIESLRKQRNELSKKISSKITPEIRQQSIELGKQIKQEEQKLKIIEDEFKNLALSCPNIIQKDVPGGGKESNLIIKTVQKKPHFSFIPKNHLELNEKLKWFDFETAATMTGAQFVIYKSKAVKLMYALINLMLKTNIKHGFEPILPPYLVKEKALINSGNLPKFEGDFYKISEDELCLIPTAEVSLTNIYENKIIPVENLPIKQTAWTSCFRKEAGTYGSEDRGLIRIHQFEKVELYTICKPEESPNELNKMLECAEDILQQLELHYRISLLAAQDCSFSSSKTYDLEVWLPGQQKFYEVSSCSNCTDFQSRRAKIRYREQPTNKPSLAHTLNGSSLALPRLIVAIMEQFQQKDGTILFPTKLQNTLDLVW